MLAGDVVWRARATAAWQTPRMRRVDVWRLLTHAGATYAVEPRRNARGEGSGNVVKSWCSTRGAEDICVVEIDHLRGCLQRAVS